MGELGSRTAPRQGRQCTAGPHYRPDLLSSALPFLPALATGLSNTNRKFKGRPPLKHQSADKAGRLVGEGRGEEVGS